ncbi:MAG TPA: flagellar biosynthesis protein FliQ [Pyrinomonadaceae bacterium]|jgi:flagellar biosynthetic protein FliQ
MDVYVDVARDALLLVLKLSLLPLMASLVVGTVVSLFQALTQVQEQTLTFVPKIIATLLVLMFSASWMLIQLQDFARHLFAMIERAGV